MANLECIPNVSEGRRGEVIDRLVAAVNCEGVRLLDISSDPDHNRSVLTLVGSEPALHEALLRLYEQVLADIDLRQHGGVHPRIGALDVVPFVPLSQTTMANAVAAAQRLAHAVGERFALPVFLYEEAASHPWRRNLAAVRRGGLAGLERRIAKAGETNGGEGWRPDAGPSRLHPSAGATVIGARFFLVAFNAVLATTEVAKARRIASRIRQSNGGLPALKAIGVELPGRRKVQVSMNLVDYRLTSPRQALAAVQQEARKLATEVLETEIVGLVPRAAVAGVSAADLLLTGTLPILEDRLSAQLPR